MAVAYNAWNWNKNGFFVVNSIAITLFVELTNQRTNGRTDERKTASSRLNKLHYWKHIIFIGYRQMNYQTVDDMKIKNSKDELQSSRKTLSNCF